MIPTTPSKTTQRRYVANVVKVYEQATAEQRVRGITWYLEAHMLAYNIADGDARKGAGVIAALSANKAWDMNQRLARRAFAGDVSGHTADALGKVRRILDGDDPADVLPMDIKTGHFFRSIANPGDETAVCIDRHAHDVAYGKALGNATRGLKGKRYESLADIYRAAARELGILPSVLQATTWVVWTESLAGVKRRPVVERYAHVRDGVDIETGRRVGPIGYDS